MNAAGSQDGPATASPDKPGRIALVLQGGGALGAYQAGVYEALHDAGLEPDWVAGVSIGGINAAIIAGNPPETRVARLREFWDRVTSRQVWIGDTPGGDNVRKLHNAWSSMMTGSFGQPGFFKPRSSNPWLAGRGSKGSTSYYDSAPLQRTLEELVDFDRINAGGMRFAVGAVNVGTGNFAYFDNKDIAIAAPHVLASGALPPAMPMVRIGEDHYWDGGMVSNTPLQHLLDNVRDDILVFQVDLFSARGPIPRDMFDVQARTKEIQYSSRTRLTTDHYMQLHRQRVRMRRLLAKIPEAALSAEERALRADLAFLPKINILHLIYQEATYEGQARDFEFSSASMKEHWEAGMRDTNETLSHRHWLTLPHDDAGVAVYDAHRPDREWPSGI